MPGLAAVWPRLARTFFRDRPKLAGLLRYGRTLPGAYFLRRGLYLPEELPGLMGRDAAEEALRRYDPIDDPVAGKNGQAGDAWTAVHLLETTRYMRNQLLRDSDWASMASSVELRVPLVDAWLRERLAANGFEPARGQGKAALVRQAAPELPAALWTRPKSGFFIPVMEWMEPGGGAEEPGGAVAAAGGAGFGGSGDPTAMSASRTLTPRPPLPPSPPPRERGRKAHRTASSAGSASSPPTSPPRRSRSSWASRPACCSSTSCRCGSSRSTRWRSR